MVFQMLCLCILIGFTVGINTDIECRAVQFEDDALIPLDTCLVKDGSVFMFVCDNNNNIKVEIYPGYNECSKQSSMPINVGNPTDTIIVNGCHSNIKCASVSFDVYNSTAGNTCMSQDKMGKREKLAIVAGVCYSDNEGGSEMNVCSRDEEDKNNGVFGYRMFYNNSNCDGTAMSFVVSGQDGCLGFDEPYTYYENFQCSKFQLIKPINIKSKCRSVTLEDEGTKPLDMCLVYTDEDHSGSTKYVCDKNAINGKVIQEIYNDTECSVMDYSKFVPKEEIYNANCEAKKICDTIKTETLGVGVGTQGECIGNATDRQSTDFFLNGGCQLDAGRYSDDITAFSLECTGNNGTDITSEVKYTIYSDKECQIPSQSLIVNETGCVGDVYISDLTCEKGGLLDIIVPDCKAVVVDSEDYSIYPIDVCSTYTKNGVTESMKYVCGGNDDIMIKSYQGSNCSGNLISTTMKDDFPDYPLTWNCNGNPCDYAIVSLYESTNGENICDGPGNTPNKYSETAYVVGGRYKTENGESIGIDCATTCTTEQGFGSSLIVKSDKNGRCSLIVKSENDDSDGIETVNSKGCAFGENDLYVESVKCFKGGIELPQPPTCNANPDCRAIKLFNDMPMPLDVCMNEEDYTEGKGRSRKYICDGNGKIFLKEYNQTNCINSIKYEKVKSNEIEYNGCLADNGCGFIKITSYAQDEMNPNLACNESSIGTAIEYAERAFVTETCSVDEIGRSLYVSCDQGSNGDYGMVSVFDNEYCNGSPNMTLTISEGCFPLGDPGEFFTNTKCVPKVNIPDTQCRSVTILGRGTSPLDVCQSSYEGNRTSSRKYVCSANTPQGFVLEQRFKTDDCSGDFDDDIVPGVLKANCGLTKTCSYAATEVSIGDCNGGSNRNETSAILTDVCLSANGPASDTELYYKLSCKDGVNGTVTNPVQYTTYNDSDCTSISNIQIVADPACLADNPFEIYVNDVTCIEGTEAPLPTTNCKSVQLMGETPIPIDICNVYVDEDEGTVLSTKFICDGNDKVVQKIYNETLDCTGNVFELSQDKIEPSVIAQGCANSNTCDYLLYSYIPVDCGTPNITSKTPRTSALVLDVCTKEDDGQGEGYAFTCQSGCSGETEPDAFGVVVNYKQYNDIACSANMIELTTVAAVGCPTSDGDQYVLEAQCFVNGQNIATSCPSNNDTMNNNGTANNNNTDLFDCNDSSDVGTVIIGENKCECCDFATEYYGYCYPKTLPDPELKDCIWQEKPNNRTQINSAYMVTVEFKLITEFGLGLLYSLKQGYEEAIKLLFKGILTNDNAAFDSYVEYEFGCSDKPQGYPTTVNMTTCDRYGTGLIFCPNTGAFAFKLYGWVQISNLEASYIKDTIIAAQDTFISSFKTKILGLSLLTDPYTNNGQNNGNLIQCGLGAFLEVDYALITFGGVNYNENSNEYCQITVKNNAIISNTSFCFDSIDNTTINFSGTNTSFGDVYPFILIVVLITIFVY